MLARTPNSHPTLAHLPDIGGDIPAAAAHSSAKLGIENKWGNKKIVHAYRHMTKTTFFGGKKSTLKKGGVHVDAQRVQTVVTKIESESFCVH